MVGGEWRNMIMMLVMCRASLVHGLSYSPTRDTVAIVWTLALVGCIVLLIKTYRSRRNLLKAERAIELHRAEPLRQQTSLKQAKGSTAGAQGHGKKMQELIKKGRNRTAGGKKRRTTLAGDARRGSLNVQIAVEGQ